MDLKRLTTTSLFQSIPPEEIFQLLQQLQARTQTFSKGTSIYRAGEPVQALGLVLTGQVVIQYQDFWGHRSVLDSVAPGQLFAESYACFPQQPLMVEVVAAQESQVLFLNLSSILTLDSQPCPGRGQLLHNLLLRAAEKNLLLSRRIFYTTSKTIRQRLLAYLSDQAIRQGSHQFTIPFDREQLANYLNVDRSALSHELGKLQKEGLLTTRKRTFLLHHLPSDPHHSPS